MATLTEAPAQGGTLEATWFETSLAKMFPELIGALEIPAKTAEALIDPLQIALNIVVTAQNIAALLPEIANAAIIAIDLVVRGLIQVIIDQINNLRNTGHALILLPVSPGGYRGASRVIRSALLNTRDAQRPVFQTGATVAGWGVIAAADIDTIKKLIAAIQTLFLASDRISAQSGLVKTTLSLNFPDPFAAQKVAGRPAPQNTPQWLRMRVIDLIPGGDDAFDNLIGILRSLQAPLPSFPLADYLAFLNKIIARIKAILELVLAILALLRALFVDIPVKVIEFDAQFGSTQDIADSIPAWFNPAQPILADVPDDLYTCGVFAVIGAEDPFSPGVQLDLLRTLILPTPSGTTPPGG